MQAIAINGEAIRAQALEGDIRRSILVVDPVYRPLVGASLIEKQMAGVDEDGLAWIHCTVDLGCAAGLVTYVHADAANSGDLGVDRQTAAVEVAAEGVQ